MNDHRAKVTGLENQILFLKSDNDSKGEQVKQLVQQNQELTEKNTK